MLSAVPSSKQKNRGNSTLNSNVPQSGNVATTGQKTAPSSKQTKRRAKVTPTPKVVDTELARRMKVDKNIVDELLLVCGVIGTTTSTSVSGGNQQQELLVPVTDCINWLQDLQRCLRRDDDLYRPISLLLGQWKIVSHKLLPLVLHSRFDTPLVLTVCKILVILTKPLSSNTVNAGCMVIDTKSGKISDSVIDEQKLLRENALQQAALLVEYKRVICHHPSHRSNARSSSGEGGILSIFVSLLAEPLSRTGNARTDADHLTIELVLHLFRNLLTAEPLLKTTGSEDLHYELVSLLERELVLEILLVLSADIEQRENAPYNLLLMELLHLLLRHQNPIHVAQSGLSTSLSHRSNNSSSRGATTGSNQRRAGNVPKVAAGGAGSLLGSLQREKQALVASATSRHSHFAGTLKLEKSSTYTGSGKSVQVVNVALLGQQHGNASSALQPMQRKSKYAEPFIGAASSVVREDCTSISIRSPVAMRAAATLHTFCQRFMATCYGPVMKSLKNEFRRDSVRLEDGDRVVLFQMITFFSKWWRMARQFKTIPNAYNTADGETTDGLSNGIGHLIFTMDVFTFNMVLNATDNFVEHKKYGPLAHSVALLAEMLHLLHSMYKNEQESQTEHIMAMGLMDRLYYGGEPLDRLPKLLSRWTLGTCTRQYVCDLIEVCHVTMQLLDTSAAACKGTTDIATTTADKDSDQTRFDTIAKMKATAADFEVGSYFARKIVSNHTVSMYTYLLQQYATNPLHVNTNIVSFFRRLSAHTLSLGDENVDTSTAMARPNGSLVPMRNPLAAKTVTFAPLLYNVQLLMVLNSILNDKMIRKDADYANLLQFATTTMFSFAAAAHANKMLFVEAIFKHPFPHRFCDLVNNAYVTDDLRMLAERDWLKAQQQQEQVLLQARAAALQQDGVDDESDDELEFTDAMAAPNPSTVAATGGISSTTTTSVGVVSSKPGSDEDDDQQPKESDRGLVDSDDSDEDLRGHKKQTRRKITSSSRPTMQDMQKRIRDMDAASDQSSDDEPAIEMANRGSGGDCSLAASDLLPTATKEATRRKKARIAIDSDDDEEA